MSKNQYAKALQQARKTVSNDYAEIRGQIDCDGAMLAANEVFQMGPGRARQFYEAMVRYVNEISELFVEDSKGDVTLEYAKHTLDKRIIEIVGEENFAPWDVRYGRQVFKKRG